MAGELHRRQPVPGAVPGRLRLADARRPLPHPPVPAGRHRGPQRRRRRLLPLRRRRAAGHPLRHRPGLRQPADDRQRHDRSTTAPTGRRRSTCGSTRPTARRVRNLDDGSFWRFAGGAPLQLGGCDGCAAVAIDNQTLRARRHRDAVDAAHARGAGRGHLPHDRRALLPRRGRRRRPALRLRAARRLPGRGRDRRRHDRRASAAAVCSPRPRTAPCCAACPSKQLWEIIGGKRRQTFANVCRRHRRRRRRDRRDRRSTRPPPSPVAHADVLAADHRPLRRSSRSRTRFTALASATSRRARRSSSPARARAARTRRRPTPSSPRAASTRSSRFRKARLRAKAVVTVTVTSRRPASARSPSGRCARPSSPSARDSCARGRGAAQAVLMVSSSRSAWAAPSRNAHASSICSRSPTIPKSTRFL